MLEAEKFFISENAKRIVFKAKSFCLQEITVTVLCIKTVNILTVSCGNI